MDGSRFDDLTRTLGAPRSRRAILGALAGAALASLGVGSAAANGANTCRAVGNSCNGNGNCCSHHCVKESRTRKICHCATASDCPAPADACQVAVCNPDGSCGAAPKDCGGGQCLDGVCCLPGGAATGACSAGQSAACCSGVCVLHETAPAGYYCCDPEPMETTCDGVSGTTENNCGQLVDCGPACAAAGASCQQDSDCCSTVCVDEGLGGTCRSGKLANLERCDGDSDCQSGLCCGGYCSDLTDVFNCGACGNWCQVANGHAACLAGQCKIDSCVPGYVNCDGRYDTGCEAHVASDPANCGSCQNACASGPHSTATCINGVCGLACDSGWADCNGFASDGCEADLASTLHCGQCNHSCSIACLDGQCFPS